MNSKTYGTLMPMTKDDLYEVNLRHNGWERQAMKAVEEMAELTQQLMKAIVDEAPNTEAICMELADVRITCEQLWLNFNTKGLADQWYENHLNRQADRIATHLNTRP